MSTFFQDSTDHPLAEVERLGADAFCFGESSSESGRKSFGTPLRLRTSLRFARTDSDNVIIPFSSFCSSTRLEASPGGVSGPGEAGVGGFADSVNSGVLEMDWNCCLGGDAGAGGAGREAEFTSSAAKGLFEAKPGASGLGGSGDSRRGDPGCEVTGELASGITGEPGGVCFGGLASSSPDFNRSAASRAGRSPSENEDRVRVAGFASEADMAITLGEDMRDCSEDWRDEGPPSEESSVASACFFFLPPPRRFFLNL